MHAGAREAAQRYYEQLRAALEEPVTDYLAGHDRAAVEVWFSELVDRFLRDHMNTEDIEQARAIAERKVAQFMRGHEGLDEMRIELLSEIQDRIEGEIPTSFPDARIAVRPLVRPLRTGQLNAVCTLAPGHSDAYLVLVEDQMEQFWGKLSEAVAWAIPRGPANDDDTHEYLVGVSEVTERVDSDPDVLARFIDAVAGYAITGRFDQAAPHPMLPPGYLNYSTALEESLKYFVVGHEYAHILLGHLHNSAQSRGVLPIHDVSTLAFSWKQEIEADLMGMVLAINCTLGRYPIEVSFAGMSLFFDALDVMDRAVSLLETGDENVRQLGSHPPSYLRRQRLRDSLEQLARADDTRDTTQAEGLRAGLYAGEIQADVVRLLWERTRPRLLDLRERGVRAASTWRTIPKEAPESRPDLASLEPNEAAWHFHQELLARTDAALGLRAGVDPAALKTELDRFIHIEQAEASRGATVHFGRDFRDLDDLFSDVLVWAEKMMRHTSSPIRSDLPGPFVGQLRTGQLNAVIAPIPGHWAGLGACMTLIDDEFALFALKFGEAVLSAVSKGRDAQGRPTYSLSEADATERINAQPMLAARFADIVSAYAISGSVVGQAIGGLSGDRVDFAATLRDYLIRFVLGQAYAHFLLHAPDAPLRTGILPVADVETLTHTWQQDLAADEVSMGFLAAAAVNDPDTIGFAHAYLGISLFLDIVDVMDRVVSLLETGEEQARQLGSHPPSDLRKRNLSMSLPTHAEELQHVVGMAEVQGKIVHLLWDRARPYLVERHRQGARPAPMWRTIPKETETSAAHDR